MEFFRLGQILPQSLGAGIWNHCKLIPLKYHEALCLEKLGEKDKADEIFSYIFDKVILVTGGGGSIGSELCRQIASSAPKQLIIFDIYENNANMATRRLRSRILAILPSWFVEDAIEECKKTLAGRNDTPLIDRVKKMVVAFAKIGVTQEQIEKRLKKKIDTMNADDFVEYTGIYNAIKQGESKIAEWFESDPIASDLTNELKGDVL